MNKACKLFIGLLLSLLVGVSIFLLSKKQNDEKLYTALSSYQSFAILYALNNNKENEAKEMLASDITQVVLNYDKELFSKSRSLSNLCDVWEKGFKTIVINHINQKDFYNTSYEKKVLYNINLIDNDCI